MWAEQQFLEVSGEPATRLDHLRKQERIWFSWVCRLHDLHDGVQTPQSAAVLAIARRRWADARRALERAEAQAAMPRESLDLDEARAQSN